MSHRQFHPAQRRSLPRRSSTNARRRPLPPRLRRRPRPRLRPYLRRRPCSRPQPRPPPRRPLPLARPGSAVVQAAPAPPAAAPNPAPNAGQQAASPPAPRRALAPPRLRPSSPRSLRLLQLRRSPKRHCRRPRPDGTAQQVAGVFAPKNLAQLVGTWAYSEGDCDRLFQRRGGGWAFRPTGGQVRPGR